MGCAIEWGDINEVMNSMKSTDEVISMPVGNKRILIMAEENPKAGELHQIFVIEIDSDGLIQGRMISHKSSSSNAEL